MLGKLLDSPNFAQILVFGTVGVTVAAIIYVVAAYLLNAFAVCKMSENLNLKNPKFAFIPIVNAFALGRIAELQKDNETKKPLKYSYILLALRIVALVLAIVLAVVAVNSLVSILTYANNALEGNEPMTAAMFESVGTVIWFYIATMIASVVTAVVNYICVWRVFNIYECKNAVAKLVVSIIISIFAPVFLFTLRNKEAKVKIEEE